MTPPKWLNREEARKRCFRVSGTDLFNRLTPALAKEALRQREVIRDAGGEIDYFGWPDGATVSSIRLNVADPVDFGQVMNLYYMDRIIAAMVMMSQADHADA